MKIEIILAGDSEPKKLSNGKIRSALTKISGVK